MIVSHNGAYAGSIDPNYFALFDHATRKIPYRIVIGTKDVIFPLDEVRATRDALKSRGFPVEYLEMPGQTHNYLRSAKEINGRTWEFFQRNPLPEEPKYTLLFSVLRRKTAPNPSPFPFVGTRRPAVMGRTGRR